MASTFSIQDYYKSGFKNVEKDVTKLKEATDLILKDPSAFVGSQAPVAWAQEAQKNLAGYERALAGQETRTRDGAAFGGQDLANEYLDNAYSWLTGSKQSHIAKGALSRYESSKRDVAKKITDIQTNIANTLDFGDTMSEQEKATLTARANSMKQELQQYIDLGTKMGLDVGQAQAAFQRDARGNFVPTAEISKYPAGGPPSPTEVPPTTTTPPPTNTQQNQWKSAAGQEDLASRVGSTDGKLVANKDFVNAAFMAYHGRNATAQELASFTNKTVDEVRNNVAAGAPQNKQATVGAGTTATTIDNTIDGRAFVEGGTGVSVGGTPNLVAGVKSPIFTDPNNPNALFYIPQGSNQPVRITDPAQLQALAAQGVIEINGQRRPLGDLSSFLSNQTGTVGSPTGTPDATGTIGGATGGTGDGFITGLAKQMQAGLEPINKGIADMQKAYLAFNPTDLSTFRDQLQAKSGIDDIMDNLSKVDSQIADLLNVKSRVPATTLARAENTMIAQGVLDRQRTEELGKLAAASAPLTNLKEVLQGDYDRRIKLIDDAVDLKKEADAWKFQQLGNALDIAVQNRTMAQSDAQLMFDAAVKDFENGVNKAEKEKELTAKAIEAQNKAIADFYEAQGYVIDPDTNELVKTLELQRFQKTESGGSGSGSGSSSKKYSEADIAKWANAMKSGLAVTQIPNGMEADVVSYLQNEARYNVQAADVLENVMSGAGGFADKLPVEIRQQYEATKANLAGSALTRMLPKTTGGSSVEDSYGIQIE